MFIDASPKYTNSDLSYKRENPIVVERFIKKLETFLIILIQK